jgi:hypothetical protein
MSERAQTGRRGRRYGQLLLALAWPGVAGAQHGVTTLVGSVRDSAGHPVAGVEIRVPGAVAGRSSDAGGFRITSVPVGATTVVIRRLGFAPATVDVTLREGRIDSLVVSLATVVAELPGVVVEDEALTRSKRLLPGFWERRSRGFGAFVTRDEIEARQTSNFVDLVRHLPSANVVSVNGRPAIRFKRYTTVQDCPPQYWVDGMRIESASPDEFTPEDVEAIEVYAGPATIPVQFAPRPFSYTCGAIVIWTRLPGT